MRTPTLLGIVLALIGLIISISAALDNSDNHTLLVIGVVLILFGGLLSVVAATSETGAGNQADAPVMEVHHVETKPTPPKPIEVSAEGLLLRDKDGFFQAVVGESHYQGALRAAKFGATNPRGRVEFTAFLFPDPTNSYGRLYT
jgi:hypothetical protein